MIKKLVDKGWEVHALHRDSSSPHEIEALGAKPVAADILHPMSLHKAIPLFPDAIFHMAGDTSQWKPKHQMQWDVNVLATDLIIEFAIGKRAKRLIHTSSIAAFGMHDQVIDENTPSNADQIGHHYSETKWIGESHVLKARKRGLDTVILNPGHIVGPGDTRNWVQLIQKIADQQLPGIPSGSGNFIHVDDVAEAHVRAFESGIDGERYLLGGDRASFLEFIQITQDLLGLKRSQKFTPDWIFKTIEPLQRLISSITGNEPTLTPEKILILTHQIQADDSKARKAFQMEFKPLRVAISDTIDWMRQEGMISQK